MLLLWAVVLMIFGALVSMLIQAGCKIKKKDAFQSAPTTEVPQKTQPRKVKPPQGISPAPISPDVKKTLPETAPPVVLAPNKTAETRTQQPQLIQPRVALIIDDLGQADTALVSRLCNMNITLTVAILPFLQYSRDSANIARSKGMEVILHMPMEPIGYPGPGKNPGMGAVLFDQPESEVRKKVAAAMLDIPYAVGLNNHMGSRITPDYIRMVWILGEVKKAKWYFLDSRTEKDTVAMEVARELGIPALERKVFLDDSSEPTAMARQWERALTLARQDGQVVIIGHIHPETVEFLERVIKGVRNEMVFVKASELAR
jgi:polysaccharide deacetylase 2 family uncharacterized protein YibQ